jgi:hypothetical protein
MKDRAGLSIAHYSPSAGDMLRTSRTQGTTERIMNEDIFKVLAERSPSSSSVMKSYKKAVTDLLTQGKAVSVDIELNVEGRTRNERMISHWTPCKDEEGRPKYVVLILAESRDL